MTEFSTKTEPIAIIGMGCRFPGADNPQAFWQLLHDGVDAIREVPPSRWDIDAYFDPDPDVPGKMYTRYSGFIDQVDQFDPQFFNISPREALSLDPQQRLLLEVTWEALEHANLVPEELYGSPTGVYVGISNTDYVSSALAQLRTDIVERIDAYYGTGNAFSAAAGRLSFLLRLTGPNIAIDTACSSSLVALHLACQSLKLGECNLALAAGVNLILSPAVHIAFTKARMLAPDGHCKTFDASADGYVRGEGCGVVVLKRLSDALADGDTILAVVRGTSINQDGPSSGLTVPSGPSQVAVIRQALENAGVSASDISYIEAHGTGTFLGDPIEASALAEVFGQDHSIEPPLYIGSVKTNIGHLESAAGMASLIKTILAMQNQEIPQNLHFNSLNPHIPWEGLPLTVPDQRIPWAVAAPRLAGISGFGFSGTNAHIILEEAPGPLAGCGRFPDQNSHAEDGQACAQDLSSKPLPIIERPYHLLTLTARDETALKAIAGRYSQYLRSGRMADRPETGLADICFTANTCRSRFRHRLGVVAARTDEAQESLAAFANGQPAPNLIHGQSGPSGVYKIAFLFTGQGAQSVNMGRRLYETQPTFREVMDQCDEILRPQMEQPLLSVLYPNLVEGAADQSLEEDHQTGIHATANTQPALFALEYALATLWRSWGIEPSIVLGHSIGEYVAACVAGVFSLEDGLRLIARRGRLMQALPLNGRMLAVFAHEATVTAALEGYAERVSLAAYNGPQNIVISGESNAVHDIQVALEAQGIQTQALEVSHAFHSPLMDPILDEFEQVAGQVAYSAPRIPLISNLYGRLAADDEATSPSYWRRHVRQPVCFMQGMAALAKFAPQAYLEIGPHPILLGLGRQCLSGEIAQAARSVPWLASLRRGAPDWQQLLTSLASLYIADAPIDWRGFEAGYAAPGTFPTRRKVNLPTYPFQRRSYWFGMTLDQSGQLSSQEQPGRESGPHPLLGERLPVAGTGSLYFDTRLCVNKPAFMGDHRILGKAFMPATAVIEVALAAGASYFHSDNLVVKDAIIDQPLVLPENKQVSLQTVLEPIDAITSRVQMFSLVETGDRGSKDTIWVRHVSALVLNNATQPPTDRFNLPEWIERQDKVEVPRQVFYQQARMAGFDYGPAFQTIQEIWRLTQAEPLEALARVELPGKMAGEAADYKCHPALLDGCLQPGILAFAGSLTLSMPVRLTHFALYAPHPSRVWVHVRVLPAEDEAADKRAVRYDIYDDQGAPVAEVEGLSQLVDRRKLLRALHGDIRQWMYALAWEPDPLGVHPAPPVSQDSSTWLILCDQAGLGVRLAERLQARGDNCVLARPGPQFARLAPDRYQVNPLDALDFQQLIQDLLSPHHTALQGVIHLWSLDTDSVDAATPMAVQEMQALICGSTLHLVQAIRSDVQLALPRLWLVTRGAQSLGEQDQLTQPAQSALWGLGRAIAIERPELHCVRLDLDPDDGVDPVQDLFDAIWFASYEDQVVYRAAQRYVARLVRHGQPIVDKSILTPPDGPFKLAISGYGILDNLTLAPHARQAPGPGEIEIQVHAAGLNFRDVLNALGMLQQFAAELGIDRATELPFGGECAGVVVATGEGVIDFQVGDAVIAGLAIGSLASHVTTPVQTVLLKPPDWSFEESVTLPVAFLTASYGLHTLAQMKAGDRVLIHAAAGGVGQAAVQLAQKAGAEIFATASLGKWEHLAGQGIQHIMDSRSLDFADQIMHMTAGQGVDIVLNSLSGDFILKSLEALGMGGRFVELGAIGILTPDDLQALRPDIAYFPFNLLKIAQQDPDALSSTFASLAQAIQAGELQPLAYHTFTIEQAISAFRFMAMAKHIGKIVITFPETPPQDSVPEGEPGKAVHPLLIRPDASYLITGGFGALGLQLANWLVMEGARNLVLSSRHGAHSPEAQTAIHILEQAGANLLVVQADISSHADLARLLSEAQAAMPPLRGIFHTAGVLDDGVLNQLTWERFETVMAPKVAGAWNLHLQTLHLPLDFFVCFSSIASLLGSPGQANYAAANAYMDGLVHYRHALGLPGLSINWGPWAEVGMAARLDRRYQARQTSLGLDLIPPTLGLQALEECLAINPTQVAVMPVDWRKFFQQFPFAAELPLLSTFSTKRGGGTSGYAGLREKLKGAPPGERKGLLLDFLRSELARIMGLGSAGLIEPQQRLLELGLDSLMAVELVTSLESNLGTNLPATMVFNYPTLQAVVDYIIDDILSLGGTAELTPAGAGAPIADPLAGNTPEPFEETTSPPVGESEPHHPQNDELQP